MKELLTNMNNKELYNLSWDSKSLFMQKTYSQFIIYAGKRTRDQDIAAEAILFGYNQVFCKKRVPIKTTIIGYLKKTIWHRIYDLEKKNKIKTIPIEHSNPSINPSLSIENEETDKELKKLLAICFSHLTENQRVIVYHRFALQMSHKEIGEKLNKTEANVKQVVYEVKKKLKEKGYKTQYYNIFEL